MCRAGLLTETELEHALSVQASSGRPLGDVIVSLGYASPGAVANALAEQHGGTLKTEYGISTGLGSKKPKPPPEDYILVVATPSGETVIRREGKCPEEGAVITDAQGRRFVVKRVATVRCAYLEPAP